MRALTLVPLLHKAKESLEVKAGTVMDPILVKTNNEDDEEDESEATMADGTMFSVIYSSKKIHTFGGLRYVTDLSTWHQRVQVSST